MSSIPPDRQEACSGPPTAGTWDKWNQAGAQAYYACRYFAAVQDTNTVRNIIAGLQLLAQYYFADKQYETAKQAQNRLDNISNIELSRSGQLFGQFTKQIPQEDAQLALAVQRLTIPEPDYNSIRLRITASVVRQFTEARRKLMQCYPVSCMAAQCEALAKLDSDQAREISAQVEQAFQKERALYETRLAAARGELAEVLKFGRGGLGAASAALNGAQVATNQAANINPYGGFIQAVNSTAQTLQGISTQEALSFRGMGANVGSAINLGNTANTTATSFMGPPQNLQGLDSSFDQYMIQSTLDQNSNGFVRGESGYNDSSINSLGGPLNNIQT